MCKLISWKWFALMVAGITGPVLSQNPIHVTYLWHMHQPIYFPYETVNQTDSAGRFNFSVKGVHDQRTGAYGDWPKNAVQQGTDLPHAGVQVSFSGSLMENMNGLYGTGWREHYRWGRNGLRTVRNNPRLDTVGIAYHHSLMPLTTKESMRMQIRLHKEAVYDNWNTGGNYSKGFWPPECAFDVNMIPALVEEGLEWVIIDNGHFDRATQNYPWAPASSIRPNRADKLNPDPATIGSQWVQLNNVWAPTKVSAPWGYQPHQVQYIDPNSDPASPNVKKIVAVPAGRYEGNENGRGGYGAFKPENVWGTHVDKNNNAQRPMILLCHSDGDNFGMLNADAYNGQHGNFLNMIRSNPNFSHTSVQDYLELYPVPANDVIHVEPGSWVGIDGGTPYFEKWRENNARDGEHPDFWSWSVLVAAANRVIHADDLEKNYTMNDVRWNIGPDTAKAWHYFLQAETSCHWYWDYDRANPWDGNATRGANLAVAEANKVIGRHPSTDRVGPTIWPAQRDIYNPGGLQYNEAAPASSDFTVFSFVYDVNNLTYVQLKWRTDYDGENPINEYDNELYARNPAKVSEWNSVAMNADWYPTVKGPMVPDPAVRAQRYRAMITGQNNVLIDYYIEAVDTKGNVSRSDIARVWVGDSSLVGPTPSSVSFSSDPRDCADLTVTYKANLGVLSNVNPVVMKHRFTTNGAFSTSTMTYTGGTSTYTLAVASIPDNAEVLQVYFQNGAGSQIDNVGGNNYSVFIRDCDGPTNTVWTTPALPVAGESVTITYNPFNRPLANATAVNIHHGYNNGNWTTAPGVPMIKSGVTWTYTYTIPAAATNIVMAFNQNNNPWDSNGGADYNFPVSGGNPEQPVPTVSISPANPVGCDPITITYNPSGRTLSGTSQVRIHIGGNNWQGVIEPNPAMTQVGDVWTYQYTPTPGTTNINMVFNNGGKPPIWDNNNSANWKFVVEGCAALPEGFVITQPSTNITVGHAFSNYTIVGMAGPTTGHLVWTNTLTGASGAMPVASPWSIPGLALGVGSNFITVMGSNVVASGIQTTSHDRASNYANWTNGSNQGSGFGAWTLASTGTAGHFIGMNGFGLWSHEGGNSAEAIRPLVSTLVAGQTVQFRMQNNWIWENGGNIGVALRDAGGVEKWVLRFVGGATNYSGTDGVTDIPWTSAGLDIAFTMTGATNYSVDVTPVGGTKRTYTGVITGTISAIRSWSANNGTVDEFNSNRDFYFNNLAITSLGEGSVISTSDTVVIVRQNVGGGDSNGDGIPDAWYQRYGINHMIPGLAESNTVGGGVTYREAYVYDLNPTNTPAGNPNRIAHMSNPQGVDIRIEAPTSTNRIYDVYWATSLYDTVWVPMGMSRPGNADQSAVILTVTNNPPIRYYRTGASVPNP
jgi:hypothetical protein